MEFQDSRTVTVNCPDGTSIKIDNVPYDTTPSLLISAVLSVYTPPSNDDFDFELQAYNETLKPDDAFADDTVDLILIPKKQSLIMTFFFSLLFFVGFGVSAFCIVFKSISSGISVFIGFSMILGVLSLLLKPSGRVFLDGSRIDLRGSPVLDFLWLFVRSFWWKFRLEDILIHNQ